jgi:hypothetical protein
MADTSVTILSPEKAAQRYVAKDDMPVVPLDDTSGWDVAMYYEGTREIAFGIRSDGRLYPNHLNPVPITKTALQIDGDSIAAGWAANLSALATATGRAVAVDGIGGQNGLQIAARRGAVPTLLTMQGNAIPASGPVTVTAKTVPLLDLTTDGSQSRTGSLAGVKGTLTAVRSGTTHTYTFTRSAAGAALPCPPGTPFIPVTNPDAHTILITGRNDIGQGVFRTPLDTILGNIEKQLNHVKRRDRVLLLSVLPRADEDRIGQSTRAVYEQLNDAYRTTFSAQFVDWGAYLRSDAAFSAAGITRTATDDADIVDGVTPASLRGDILHPNVAAYKAANVFIPAVIASRDWN